MAFCALLTDQQYSWSPTQHFNEGRYSPAPRNMKGLPGGRTQAQLCSGHTCGLAAPEDCEHEHLHHAQEARQPYLLSPVESCPMDHHRCSPGSSVHSECMMMPVVLGDHMSSSTFPRMHYSSHYDTRDDCAVSHASTRVNRIPANLLDQFEKQLPLHRDGFHTLQYQRTSTAAEQRSESPGRIRHLVHSVQKLFTKSHSLEGSSKSNVNGTKGDGRVEDHHHGHHPKHGKRSKSKERKPEGKHRSGTSSWWSSDDNLDSDSTCRTSSVANRHHVDHVSHCYPEVLPGPFGDLSLKTSKSNSDVKCSACEGLTMTPDTKYMKRSSWSTLTVSQAKEAYRKSSLNLDKPLVHQEVKPSLRPCHYLQVRGLGSRVSRVVGCPAPGGRLSTPRPPLVYSPKHDGPFPGASRARTCGCSHRAEEPSQAAGALWPDPRPVALRDWRAWLESSTHLSLRGRVPPGQEQAEAGGWRARHPAGRLPVTPVLCLPVTPRLSTPGKLPPRSRTPLL